MDKNPSHKAYTPTNYVNTLQFLDNTEKMQFVIPILQNCCQFNQAHG